jgi:hypothetical protein
MRPTAWVSLLAVSLMTAAAVNGLSSAQARPAPARGQPADLPSWVVTGQWMTTDEEAVDDALNQARDKVQEYLRSQKPPMTFPLDPTYLRQNLWHDLKADDAAFKALGWEKIASLQVNGGKLAQTETKSFEGLGDMHRAAVLVEVNARTKAEFERQEEQYQAKQRESRATHRQGVLARVLAGLVAVLAAVALYFRLEDATKGYYTTLLRVAAVTFIALIVAGLLVLG